MLVTGQIHLPLFQIEVMSGKFFIYFMFDDIKFDKILKNWWTESVQKDLVKAALLKSH